MWRLFICHPAGEIGMNRRTLLRTSAAALAVGLAGCGGDGDATDTPTPTPADDGGTATPTASPTASPTEGGADATPTATPSGTPEPTATGTDAATDTASATPTSTPTATATATPAQTAQTVEVGPESDQFAFVPDAFEIATGDTVAWVWRAGGHNVRVDSQPDGSDWTGTPGGSGDTYSAGYTLTHTFTTAGEYEYFCAPHESLGMVGSFTVTE
jgi:plastocyanin